MLTADSNTHISHELRPRCVEFTRNLCTQSNNFKPENVYHLGGDLLINS